MKNLLIIRHAKSSWSDTLASDRDRLLNKRGERDAPFMGNRLKELGLIPDRILSSPACRAMATADAIARELSYATNAIDVHETIYMQGVSALVSLVQALPETWQRVYLIGHNPDLGSLVEYLTGESIGHLPTCGIASIEFDLQAWEFIMAGSGRLAFFDYPKRRLPPD